MRRLTSGTLTPDAIEGEVAYMYESSRTLAGPGADGRRFSHGVRRRLEKRNSAWRRDLDQPTVMHVSEAARHRLEREAEKDVTVIHGADRLSLRFLGSGSCVRQKKAPIGPSVDRDHEAPALTLSRIAPHCLRS